MLHLLVQAHVRDAHAALVAPRAQAQEGDAIAMAGIHVGLDLENEAGQLRLGGLHRALAA